MTDFNAKSTKSQKNRDTSKYVLFLTNEFSQWFPSPFTSKEGIRFNTAEQYMMYQKAMLFNDSEVAAQILKAETPNEQKELGRKVKGFAPAVWNDHAQDIVYQGNYYKFTQNAHLFDVLAATKGKELVEAAHYDPVWGIGLRADDPLAEDKANWKGKNWLGGTLTKLRDNLDTAGFQPRRDPAVRILRFDDKEGQRILYIEEQEFLKQAGYSSMKDFATARFHLRKKLESDVHGNPMDYSFPQLNLTAKIGWETVTTDREVFEALNPRVLQDGLQEPETTSFLIPNYTRKLAPRPAAPAKNPPRSPPQR